MRSRYGGGNIGVDDRLRQLAILFSFLTRYQPVAQLQVSFRIRQLLFITVSTALFEAVQM
jgi:hypothetical protein